MIYCGPAEAKEGEVANCIGEGDMSLPLITLFFGVLLHEVTEKALLGLS